MNKFWMGKLDTNDFWCKSQTVEEKSAGLLKNSETFTVANMKVEILKFYLQIPWDTNSVYLYSNLINIY